MAGMRTVHSRVSFAELERWPEDGRRYELYDGEVYEVPSPIPLHQIVAGRLYVILNEYEVYTLNGQDFDLVSTAPGRERVRSPLLADLALVPGDLVPA
jgi:hypothetical protein